MDKKVKQVRTIIGTTREHNEQCRALVGKDFGLTSIGIFNALKSGIFKDTSGNILSKNRSLVVKKSMDKG